MIIEVPPQSGTHCAVDTGMVPAPERKGFGELALAVPRANILNEPSIIVGAYTFAHRLVRTNVDP